MATAFPQKAGKSRARGNGEGSKVTQFKPGNNRYRVGEAERASATASALTFNLTFWTVWNEANEKGNKTGLDALRELAATRPGQFVRLWATCSLVNFCRMKTRGVSGDMGGLGQSQRLRE